MGSMPMDKRKLGPEDIARIDEETYEEPKRESIKSPGTGGDPEHKKPLTDETNRLTT